MGTHPNPAMTTSATLRPSRSAPLSPARTAALSLLAAACLSLADLPAQAQVETFINKPGSSVGPATKVVPKNCITAPDGSLTCDTKIENSPSDTPAKPHFSPFGN